MRYFVRWWETLGRTERIVALSIGLSAPIAIINSTVWAIACAYIVHVRSRVAIERLRAQSPAQHSDARVADQPEMPSRTGRRDVAAYQLTSPLNED